MRSGLLSSEKGLFMVSVTGTVLFANKIQKRRGLGSVLSPVWVVDRTMSHRCALA